MRTASFATLISLIILATPVSASFVITIGNGTATASGSTTVSVFAHSNNPIGESLDTFGLEFRITRVSGTGSLAFTNPQSSTELASPLYVFDGNSVNQLFGSGIAISPPSSYIGGDGTVDGLGVTVKNSDRLLAILALNASLASVGDSYSISLVGSGRGNGTTFFADPGVTQFYDWSANTGTVTIRAGTNPVPMPAAMILALTGIGCFAASRRILRRTE